MTYTVVHTPPQPVIKEEHVCAKPKASAITEGVIVQCDSCQKFWESHEWIDYSYDRDITEYDWFELTQRQFDKKMKKYNPKRTKRIFIG